MISSRRPRRPSTLPLLAARLLVALAGGCAPSLSSFQPAHVAPRGSVSAEIGSDLSIPTGTLADTYDVAKTLASASRSRMLTEDEKIQLFVAGTRLALSPPALVNHVAVNYVPADRWEIGGRYSSSAFRLGARRQLLVQELSGYDLTVGLGVQRWSVGFGIGALLDDVVDIDDFTRWSLDLPLVAGVRSDFYWLWGGPRLAITSYSTSITLRAPGSAGAAASQDVAQADGSAVFVGAQVGAAIGYRVLFLAAELTVVRMMGNARLDVFGRRLEADTGTYLFYPGLALMGEF